jgi:hypothetical protein
MPCFLNAVLPCMLIISAAGILVFSIVSFAELQPMNGLAAMVKRHGEGSGQVQHAPQAPDAAEGQYLMLISAHEGLVDVRRVNEPGPSDRRRRATHPASCRFSIPRAAAASSPSLMGRLPRSLTGAISAGVHTNPLRPLTRSVVRVQPGRQRTPAQCHWWARP